MKRRDGPPPPSLLPHAVTCAVSCSPPPLLADARRAPRVGLLYHNMKRKYRIIRLHLAPFEQRTTLI